MAEGRLGGLKARPEFTNWGNFRNADCTLERLNERPVRNSSPLALAERRGAHGVFASYSQAD